jgi:Alpha/beta hydrolase of unknown function (DUF900)
VFLPDRIGGLESRTGRAYGKGVSSSPRSRIISWVLAFGAVLIIAAQWLREPDIAVTEENYRFESARTEAVKAGNHVVYSRHLVNNSGRPTWDAALSHWKQLPGVTPSGAPLQVVFVHGYNATFAQSIAQGSYLSRLVRQWTAQKAPGLAVDFHTFSWRADFGPDGFLTAELAAKAQSASLADFLRTIARPHAGQPAPKLIVITHSLGARLLLEALAKGGKEPGAPVPAGLLLVQPAVARTAVSRGTYETITGEAVTSTRYYGMFYDVLSPVGLVFATCSSADGVLGEHYFNSPEIAGAPASPKLNSALGQPYYSNTEAEVFPDSFRLVDLSPGRYLDMALPAHDSLFDASGRRAFWSLWNRLLRQATEREP